MPDMERLAQIVLEFLEAETWLETRDIVEMERDLLLTDQADQVLKAHQDQHRGNADRSRFIQFHRQLLRDCREKGTDMAFEPLMPPDETPDISSFQMTVIKMSGPSALKMISEQNPETAPVIDCLFKTGPLIDKLLRESPRRHQDDRINRLLAIRDILTMLSEPIESTADLTRHIDGLREGLTLIDRNEDPDRWAMFQALLANRLHDNPLGDRAENLEQAIEHHELSLEIYNRDEYPDQWAMAQVMLASTYLRRIRGDRSANIEKCIACCQLAEEVYNPREFPEWWLEIQMVLGEAYRNRIEGNRADNMELAIEIYQVAIEVAERMDLSTETVGIHHHLGNIYLERIRGDRAENIELAISHSQQAIEMIYRPDRPTDWASAQNSLGNAYADRVWGKRSDNLEKSIEHHELALKVRTRTEYPQDWASTQNNLALTYLERQQGSREENIEKAIQCFENALEVYTRISHPERWGMVLHNLAIAYMDRKTGSRVSNIEQAIDYYQQALEVRTRTASPFNWAMTQLNLGLAYAKYPGNLAENSARAIHHYEQALEIYTLDAYPMSYLGIQRNLGNLYFGNRNWEAAKQAYIAAIEAGNLLLEESYSRTGRQKAVGETACLFSRVAYCLLHGNEPAAALSMLEKGKTRLLAEALALSSTDDASLLKDEQKTLDDSRVVIRMLEDGLQPVSEERFTDENLRRIREWKRKQLEEKREQLKNLVQAIREERPDFIPTEIELPVLLALIPENSALVAPLITAQGSAIFIVPHGVETLSESHVVFLNDFKEAHLNALLEGSEDRPGWQREYLAFRVGGLAETWKAAIDRICGGVWDRLFGPVHDQLQKLGVKQIILMPSGGMQLLPLHAAWRMENGKKRYLLDDYEISYAPSGYALDISRRRAAERSGKAALVVGINDYADARIQPLTNAVTEARALGDLLDARLLLNAAATQSVVTMKASGCAYLHLSCHGYFDWGNTMASGLICYDESLTLAEIICELDLDSSLLVTLSACETGIIETGSSPDEYIGLPAGFLQAGVPAVVSSLWMVDDRSTAQLMERFYRNHLEAGMSLPAALRAAQLWLRDSTDYSHPYYWAAFTYMGG